MLRVQTLNPISDVIHSFLPEDSYEIGNDIQNPDAILVRSADCRNRELNQNLLAIARAGAGTNNIPIDRCTEQGVAVFNTPGANANAVKELALCCMLLASRNVMEGVAWASQLSGEDIPLQVEQGKRQFIGHELYGKTLGVIGLGAIGVMVANDAHAIGMNVIGYDPFISIEHAWGLSRAIRRGVSLAEMLPNCDYITIHVPLMDKTRNYISAEILKHVRPGAMLLNLARGELVDTAAVLDALADGRLSRYVTDFPSANIIGKPGVVCVPHLGASTPESEENCARMAAKELNEYLTLGNIENSVNLPQCSMQPAGTCRVCALHKNVTNMVGQITAILAGAGANITNMVNKSRGDLAYTLLDLDHALSETAVAEIAHIEGMMRVRMIPHIQ
ncbi:MAG: phosphoglycerate dehydrogenase [Eubacteriales bacterium]|nr:phosphoglycerate dehydrogenase [Eubacteriales bacterium]